MMANVASLISAVKQCVNSLAADAPARKLFETWAASRGRELRRSQTCPARYAVDIVNIEFEAFVLGLMRGQGEDFGI